MPSKLLQTVKRTISRYRMLNSGDAVVVAVSGGPDSVALLDILKHLSEECRLRLVVAHLNHGLRPQAADEEEDFVRKLSEHSGLAFESGRTNIAVLCRQQKTSVEETAREERYRFLEEIRLRYQADKIALGHHATDRAETVLMNLLRGSGLKGLRGMQPVRADGCIRPLIDATRAQIDEYLEWRNLPYRTDHSNFDEDRLRNRIRHKLIPELKARYNARIEENLCRTAEILGNEDRYFNAVIDELCAERQIVCHEAQQHETIVSIPAFFELHEALQNRLLKRLLERCAPNDRGIGYLHVCDVLSLMQNPQPGATLHLPFGLEVRRKYDMLVIGMRTQKSRNRISGVKELSLDTGDQHANATTVTDKQIPCRIRLENPRVILSFDFARKEEVMFDEGMTAFIDYDCIVQPLTVRTLRPGDRIQPLGMSGMKKLKHFFIDRKIPVRLRGSIPLLADGHSVIWIAGHQLSERVKITEKTSRILKIRLIEII